MTPAQRVSLSVGEYGAELLRLVKPDERSERLRLADAAGRALAAPVASRVAIPSFDNSAMDGYAVRQVDVTDAPVTLRVVGEVPAGSAGDPAAGPGECVRIMTGAALPSFADSVVPVEDTDGGTELVDIRVRPALGAHVRRAGGDIAAGDVVAVVGDRLTPGLLGALAAAGHTHVDVRPRPRVLVAATGDELVADGSPLERGQIHESNAVVLAAAVARDGADPLTGPPLRDDPEHLAEWLDRNSGGADLVI
ncbi:MAG TPA: molybdopterin molybdenumtransferase MoeA, partial [Propionicimonas sp.]|nr:molybdopterin molybdenumtransferase MoeA [Propionicimonas sp.]